MKLFIKISLLLLLPVFSIAQQNAYLEDWNKEQIDSLRLIWNTTANDTIRMATARSLGWYYEESKLDSGLYFLKQQEAIAAKLKLRLWEGDALDNVGYELQLLKNYPNALQTFLEGIKILEDKETEKNAWRIYIFSKQENPRIARLTALGWTYSDVAKLYHATSNEHDAIASYYQAIKIGESINDSMLLSNSNQNLGFTYLDIDKLDSALSCGQKAISYSDLRGYQKYKGNMLLLMGRIYFKKGNYGLSKKYFTQSIRASQQPNNLGNLAYACIGIGNLFSVIGDRDSSLWYVKRGLEISQSFGSPEALDSAYIALSRIYNLRGNIDSAFHYQGLAMAVKDSINNVEKIKLFQNIDFDQQLKVRELEKEKIENQNKIRTYSLLAGLAMLSIIAFIIYRNNRQKQKANQVLQKTLTDLKSTQSQLIQSEKMASLGELTAGIAHEIQNPLNFVNNFSEVNKELLVEMKDEMSKGNLEDANDIANDVIANSEKINHHGKRADSIVKGMLQHSRSSSSVKEPTDINALADEYLRLSYHGLRAKDNSFNATMKTDYDETIGKINIIPQDIGRVLLNLYNNAFYAVKPPNPLKGEHYEPTVTVSTKLLKPPPGGGGFGVLISVKDNGTGIPQKVVDKIFQPFFTTKPTGQGTGLGLSLSYDIIKAHAGEIKVESKEGEGSEFIIQLPIV